MSDKSLAGGALAAQLDQVRGRWMNRLHARLAGFASPVTAFVSMPEPKTIGSYARGRQLRAGNFRFAGQLIEAPDQSIWSLANPDAAFEAELQSFTWLDDLAALGDRGARLQAQAWLLEWIDLFGRGHGPGWDPALTGRRLIRWINHAVFLLKGMEKAQSDRYFRNLARQTQFLKRRWQAAPAGQPRLEALTGLIYAGLALEGADDLVLPAAHAIAEECAIGIAPDGGIPSRNPEALLETFDLLTWAASALSEAGHMPQPAHLLAIERIAPTLRALRHSDGTLARFHGGGPGREGQLDQALAASGIRASPLDGLAMGYARLASGRSSVIVDAAAPPGGLASGNAHASTLAFELISGRHPLVVNCGSGVWFGGEWRRAARTTPSHSTLAVDRYSSSRFAPKSDAGHSEWLTDIPSKVEAQRSTSLHGQTLLATHDGYSPTHGLIHVRRLELGSGGRLLSGQDTLGALSESNRIRFEEVMNQTRLSGVQFAIRFHLHPEVVAKIDLGGRAISLALPTGETWIFRSEGSADMALESSIYLDQSRLKPRATKQIVLTDTVLDYSSQANWSLSLANDADPPDRSQ
ncbi:MAG: heparinase II/III family protein [Rhodobacteraceae bacterium]|nr:heparinase II/III family protein [Paracoccaceae bacterium]